MGGPIVVPLDGSELAERALPYARTVARATQVRLLLVRAVAPGPSGAGMDTECSEADVEEARSYLADISRRELQYGDLLLDTRVVCGDPARSILKEARLHQAGLIAMVTRGATGPTRSPYGDVAQGVLVGASVPVLLVRARGERQELALESERPRILVPLDGSAAAEEALPLATSLSRSLDGQIVLVRSVREREYVLVDGEPRLAYGPDGLKTLRAEAACYLAELKIRLALEGHRVSADVRVGEPAQAMAPASRDHGAALVVMMTHCRPGRGWLPMGSVPAALLADGEIPLLLVPPPGGFASGSKPPASPRRSQALDLDGTESGLVIAALRSFSLATPDGESGLRQRIDSLLGRLGSGEDS